MSVFRDVNSNTKKRYVCLAPSQGSCREEPCFKTPRFLHRGTRHPSRLLRWRKFPLGACRQARYLYSRIHTHRRKTVCVTGGFPPHLLQLGNSIHHPAPWYFTYPWAWYVRGTWGHGLGAVLAAPLGQSPLIAAAPFCSLLARLWGWKLLSYSITSLRKGDVQFTWFFRGRFGHCLSAGPLLVCLGPVLAFWRVTYTAVSCACRSL